MTLSFRPPALARLVRLVRATPTRQIPLHMATPRLAHPQTRAYSNTPAETPADAAAKIAAEIAGDVPADAIDAADANADVAPEEKRRYKVMSVDYSAAYAENHKYPRQYYPRKLYETQAIVTGGSRGIGYAIARRLALEGVTCTLVGRDEAMLRSAAASLPPPAQRRPPPEPKEPVVAEDGDEVQVDPHARPNPMLPKHKYLVADVTDPKAWGDLFKQRSNTNYLINAAGLSYRSLLAVYPAEEIQRIYDVNLFGTTLGCRQALRIWAHKYKPYTVESERPDRVIINIASMLAVQGGFGAAAYAASKAGVVALSRALAQEGASRHVRVNAVLPGYVQTRMTESLDLQEIIKRTGVKRLGRPDEVADAVVFLIKNKFANNCALNLDGGLM